MKRDLNIVRALTPTATKSAVRSLIDEPKDTYDADVKAEDVMDACQVLLDVVQNIDKRKWGKKRPDRDFGIHGWVRRTLTDESIPEVRDFHTMRGYLAVSASLKYSFDYATLVTSKLIAQLLLRHDMTTVRAAEQ